MSGYSISARQRGLALFSVLLCGLVLGFVLLMGLRSAPAVTEFLAIKRIIVVLAAEGDTGRSDADLRQSFDRRGAIDAVSSIAGRDLLIRKEAGRTVINVAYGRTVPMVRNLSLYIDFRASSAEP